MKRLRQWLAGMLACLMLCSMIPADVVKAELITEDGYEYFLTQDGYLKNAWKTINSRRCYFDADGHMVKNTTLTINGIRYKFDKNGYMKAGRRVTKKGTRYQLASGKYLKSAWKKIKGSRYYFNKKGYMVTNAWVGKYYLTESGKMASGTWIGSKFVDASGKKVTSGSISISSPSAILIEKDTGKVIYKKNAGTKRSNASTTKIMTAILALENCELDEKVTFSSFAASQEAVKLYANAGEQFYLKDLMYALLLPSYNDVAVAIAEHVSGSQKAFAKQMNAKAKEIGCKNTTFVTASGLDEKNHGTTAADLAKIARYALKNAAFRKIIKKQSYSFTSTSSGRQFWVTTTDEFLTSMKGALGVKTGYTSKAGYCFVGALKYKGKTYISVVLGASTSDARWADTRKLMKFAKKNVKF